MIAFSLVYHDSMTILYLTCANKTEADVIGTALLEAKLVACVRQIPVSSSYWWNGAINHDDEVLLMMESVEEKFDEVDKMVAGLHSYDQYVLTSVAVSKTTAGVENWLNDILGK